MTLSWAGWVLAGGGGGTDQYQGSADVDEDEDDDDGIYDVDDGLYDVDHHDACDDTDHGEDDGGLCW